MLLPVSLVSRPEWYFHHGASCARSGDLVQSWMCCWVSLYSDFLWLNHPCTHWIYTTFLGHTVLQMPCLVLLDDVLVKKQFQVFMIHKSHVCFVHFTPSTESLTLCLKQNPKLSINNGENLSASEPLHFTGYSLNSPGLY